MLTTYDPSNILKSEVKSMVKKTEMIKLSPTGKDNHSWSFDDVSCYWVKFHIPYTVILSFIIEWLSSMAFLKYIWCGYWFPEDSQSRYGVLKAGRGFMGGSKVLCTFRDLSKIALLWQKELSHNRSIQWYVNAQRKIYQNLVA